ncbi:MAG: hypothetical protein Q7V15_04825 [Phenylobacterium sp.]|uniref:hypothetical protein n=1 Tax=Phenylobacterium sp. TaxID=1871053 RepID=UPI00271BE91B|nr:hypothetical protein [Phenylobacterium sp.]MDO8900661.1 hypothetical protein [Phenylobacterium sp.]
MSDHMYLLTIGLPLGTIIAVFALRYLAATRQAAAQMIHDQAYTDLAEKTHAELASIRGRLDGIERVLKDVG